MFLEHDQVPYSVVVEPQEAAEYKAERKGAILTLPFSNLGQGSIPARNWVWEHAKEAGHKRHWILDDNIRDVKRLVDRKRIPVHSGTALSVVEDLVDRYENVALAGLAYQSMIGNKTKPMFRNVHIYSCCLIENAYPYRWRGRYNEDTDLSLQVLSGGLCTIRVNAFAIGKVASMTMRGGNTDELYAGDGRLKMAREVTRRWPRVVEIHRRWGRPQHRVAQWWKKFDTPLIRRQDIDWDELRKSGPNEYGLELVANGG